VTADVVPICFSFAFLLRLVADIHFVNDPFRLDCIDEGFILRLGPQARNFRDIMGSVLSCHDHA
jgi:hypothetical protein